MSQDTSQGQESAAEQGGENPFAPHKILEIINKKRKAYVHPTLGDLIPGLEKSKLSNLHGDAIGNMDVPELKAFVFAMALQVDVLRESLTGVLDRESLTINDLGELRTTDAWVEICLRVLDVERMQAQQALQRENQLLKETLVDLVEELGLDPEKFKKRLYPQSAQETQGQPEKQAQTTVAEQSSSG